MGNNSVELLSIALVREYLSRKGYKNVLQEFDKATNMKNYCVNNRKILAEELNIIDLVKNNKREEKVYKTFIELIVNNLIKDNSQSSKENCSPKKTINHRSKTNLPPEKNPDSSKPTTSDLKRRSPEEEQSKLSKNETSGLLENSNKRNKLDKNDREILDNINPNDVIINNQSTESNSRPITFEEAVSLKEILFGTSLASFNSEWRQQGFQYSAQLRYGLHQEKGGPCGLLAAVQGYVLKHLFYKDENLTVKGVAVTGADPSNNGVVEAQLVLTNSDHERAPLKHHSGDDTERREDDRTSNNVHNGRHSESVVHSLTSHEELRQHTEGNIATGRSESNHDAENSKVETPTEEECPRGMRLDTSSGKRKSELGATPNCVVIGRDDANTDEGNNVVMLHRNGDNPGLSTVTDTNLAEPCCGNRIDVVRTHRRRGHRRHGSRRNRNDYNTHGKLIHVEEHHRVAQYRDDRDSKSNEQNMEHRGGNEDPRLNYQVDGNVGLGHDRLNNIDNEEDVDDDVAADTLHNTEEEQPQPLVTQPVVANTDVLNKDRGTQSITITLPTNDANVLQHATNNAGNNILFSNLVNAISGTVKKFQENEDARTVSQSLSSMIADTLSRASLNNQNPNHINLQDVIGIVDGLRGANTRPYAFERVNNENNLQHTVNTGTLTSAPIGTTTTSFTDGRNNQVLIGQLKDSFSSLLDEILNNKGNARLNLQNFSPSQLIATGNRNVNGLATNVLPNTAVTATHLNGNLNEPADSVVNSVGGDRGIRINFNDAGATNKLNTGAGVVTTAPAAGQVTDNTLNGNGCCNGVVTNGVITNGLTTNGLTTNGLTTNGLTTTGVNGLFSNDGIVNGDQGRVNQLVQMANLLKSTLAQIPGRVGQAIRKGTVQRKPTSKKNTKKSKKGHLKKKSSSKKKSS